MTYDPLRVLTNLTLVHTYEASYTFTGQVLSAGQAFLDCEFTKASASASAGLIRFAGSNVSMRSMASQPSFPQEG